MKDPRPHFYEFVHRLLPVLARQHPLAFCGAMASPESESILAEWWENLGQDLPDGERLPFPAITAASGKIGAHLLILFSFPRPEGTTEAFFAAVLLGPIAHAASPEHLEQTPLKYYVLEKGFTLDGSDRTVVGEWTAEGSHVNYGDGPPPEPGAFVDWICRAENLRPDGGGPA